MLVLVILNVVCALTLLVINLITLFMAFSVVQTICEGPRLDAYRS